MSEEQTFISHLIELRSRLVKAVAAIIIIMVVQLPFAGKIYAIMARPVMAYLPDNTSMIATGVLSPFLTPFKMVFILSIILAMPFVLYQIWAFVAPGLYKHEKRIAKPLLISSIFLFYLGCLFAYFVIFPILFQFVLKIAPTGINYMPDMNNYLDVMIRFFFAFGFAFEVPIAVILMILMGITTPEKLANNRPYVIVTVFVIGMLLTPPDVISQTLMAIPMWLLFEIGIFMGRILRKNKNSENSKDKEVSE